jgi:hypothetical protein
LRIGDVGDGAPVQLLRQFVELDAFRLDLLRGHGPSRQPMISSVRPVGARAQPAQGNRIWTPGMSRSRHYCGFLRAEGLGVPGLGLGDIRFRHEQVHILVADGIVWVLSSGFQ